MDGAAAAEDKATGDPGGDADMSDGDEDADLLPREFSVDAALTSSERLEKEQLLEAGFADWKHGDYQRFVKAVVSHGRANLDGICAAMSDKPAEEVQRYSEAFWEMGPSALGEGEWTKVLKRIEKAQAERDSYVDRIRCCSSPKPLSMLQPRGGGVARPGPCMRHPPAPPPPPRVLKDSGVGAMAPTAPLFLSHASLRGVLCLWSLRPSDFLSGKDKISLLSHTYLYTPMPPNTPLRYACDSSGLRAAPPPPRPSCQYPPTHPPADPPPPHLPPPPPASFGR